MGRTVLVLLAFLFVGPAWAQRVYAPEEVLRTEFPTPGARGPSLTGLFNTGVAFIDSAVVRTQMGMRLDFANDNNRPTRAEYFQARGGVPGGPGPGLPETSVDYQDLAFYAEYALVPTFSVFMNSPMRWINPEQNANQGGIGDMDIGFKWTMFTGMNMLSTVQLRMFIPTASASGLGTKHVSFEPALLFNYRVFEFLNLEGEFRYWAPVGGTDFAGDLLRYGVGLTYWGRVPDRIWISPVVEVMGFSVLGGQEQAVAAPGLFATKSAAGVTIANVAAGVRVGMGYRADFYAGYARALTGDVWYKDMLRFEFRWMF